MDRQSVIETYFKERTATLATMHKKEIVMKPLLEEQLKVNLTVPDQFNSDQYGTFTRDIKRRGNQLQAAKTKLKEALKLTGDSIGFASEGVFGPHPAVPFIPFNQELVVLYDQKHRLEITGIASTTETNFNHKTITSYEEAYAFCQSVGFPEHAVVIKVKETTKKSKEMIKGITTENDLIDAVEFALRQSKDHSFYIETDMRAMYNPSRMKNIEAATHDLIKNIFSCCPICSTPGFIVIESKKGLPCSLCGLPTASVLSVLYKCVTCKHIEEQFYPNGVTSVDPGHCPNCNP